MKAQGKVELKNINVKTTPSSSVQLIPKEDYDEFKKSGIKRYSDWKEKKKAN